MQQFEITNLFNDFFRYQLDMESIADWFKSKQFNTFEKVMVFLIAYFNRDYIFDHSKKKTAGNAIIYEFEKALAYKICLINNTLV